ncbi:MULTISPECIES: helix-turn-helix domain-containing protein [Serratia]|uniref:helix-turn-helix domain-containing protein n=1 Tax=Serratia TaxID=613 RepID=UPI001F092317|nr:helix-turn-helix domain-containing protein [Serratia marcescens]
MLQDDIVNDLLSWLESHLDLPLLLDNVAAKSGYSKWHLQRMFKAVTGHVLGAYIRTRRLSKAAVALRLTNQPILDIALQYRFDSQQSFTRAFKRHFAQTPALYRRDEDWNSFGICPPICLGAFTLPEPEFINWPEMHLVCLTRSYSCTLEKIQIFHSEPRSQFWHQYLGAIDTLTPHHVLGKEQKGQSLVLRGGEYAMFSYEGPTSGLQDFILMLYDTCLPALKLTRRKGYDIERIHPWDDRQTQPPRKISCDYLIPILR